MYLEVKPQLGMILSEEPQQLCRPLRMVVERAVQQAHVAYAPLTDAVESSAYRLQRHRAYGVPHPTDTERTAVEASSRGLHLHEGLPPGKQPALLGHTERCKVHHSRHTPIVIHSIMHIAQPLHLAPPFPAMPHLEPPGKALLPLATQHTVHLVVLAQVGFIVAQELGATEDHRRLWHERLHPCHDV